MTIKKSIEILEGNLIPQVQYALEINQDLYDLINTVMKLYSENYNKDYNYKNGSLMFYEKSQYEKTKELLSKLNIKFKETPDDTSNDNELQPGNNMSPYPSNTGIRNPWKSHSS